MANKTKKKTNKKWQINKMAKNINKRNMHQTK